MKHLLILLPLTLIGLFLTPIGLFFSLISLSPPSQAAANCTLESVRKREQPLSPWIDQSNWLAPENLRFGLPSENGFMPLISIKSSVAAAGLKLAPKQLDLEKLTATDPLDRSTRDVGFLLSTRLYADGVVVLRDGRLMNEHYWHGVTAQQPRFLLGASRTVLSLLGAMAIAQGKLTADKSVVRYIPALSAQTGLRKLSIQRLIEDNSRFDWTDQEINTWRAASGWTPGNEGGGLRNWLNQAELWERSFAESALNLTNPGPDADLLAWALEEAYKTSLAQVFCDQVLSKLRPENPVYWATDSLGTALSSGLSLSLRDFARLGQMLVEARSSATRSKIPNWFVETLASSGGSKKTNTAELLGLSRGSELRYGFVHLGGKANRIGVLGPYGNSLYIDFDSRLVIAIFAAYPKESSPAMLATLEEVWGAVDKASQPNGKR